MHRGLFISGSCGAFVPSTFAGLSCYDSATHFLSVVPYTLALEISYYHPGSVFHPLRFATRLQSFFIECPCHWISFYHSESVFLPLRFATRLQSISIECPCPLISYYHPGTISIRGSRLPAFAGLPSLRFGNTL